MNVRDSQDAVFNRTGRIEIPDSHIRRRVVAPCFHFDRLHKGDWSDGLDPTELASAVLYVDLRSLLLLRRECISEPIKVFDSNWQGLVVELPTELTSGQHQLKLQVTIAFPVDHPDAGRILARSGEIILVAGPDPGEGHGSSLLPVRPAADEMPELGELKIDEMEGPVFYINTGLAGVSWRELASDPKFKYGIFPSCAREILRYLIMNPDTRSTWGAAWLALEGVRGLDLPEVDDLPPRDAWQQTNDFADRACEGLLEQADLVGRFKRALDGMEGD